MNNLGRESLGSRVHQIVKERKGESITIRSLLDVLLK